MAEKNPPFQGGYVNTRTIIINNTWSTNRVIHYTNYYWAICPTKIKYIIYDQIRDRGAKHVTIYSMGTN
jgi:hypothetical protein